jgi:hypothetical protein
MKSAIVIAIVCLSLTAAGQRNRESRLYAIPSSPILKKDMALLPKLKSVEPGGIFFPGMSGPNVKPGIYRLPGGMPCLVPDVSQIAAIPNFWQGWQVTQLEGRMPNPAVKPRIKK